MPKRPKQHRTASQAVAAVRKVWAEAGAAVDEIHEDYGEDLLVQSCLNGRMDKSRIWIQAKGTQANIRLNKNRSPFVPGSIDVGRDLALRWLGSADLVVIVRWSVRHQIGWYCIPKLTLPACAFWDEHDDPISKVRIRFRRDHVFDTVAAEKIAWIARLDNAAAGIERAPKGADGRAELSPATWDTIWKLMGDLDLLELSSSVAGKISPALWNYILSAMVDYGVGMTDDHGENLNIWGEWIDRSFEVLVRNFVREQLPEDVHIPMPLFDDMFGILEIVRAITTRDIWRDR